MYHVENFRNFANENDLSFIVCQKNNQVLVKVPEHICHFLSLFDDVFGFEMHVHVVGIVYY